MDEARFKWSNVLRLFSKLISPHERRKLLLLILVQILVNTIDLIGVACLGLVGAITISGIQSQTPSDTVLHILRPLGIGDKSFQLQVIILAIIATFLLISRTLISLKLTKKTFAYFARKSVEYSELILKDTFSGGLQKVKSTSSQELVYATTIGCDILMIGVLAQGTILISDIALLMLMGIGIFLVQPATALVSLLVFGSAAAYMHYGLNSRSRKLGQAGASQAVMNNRSIQELFESYREIHSANKSENFIATIRENRIVSTVNQAEINYLPILNKYFLETTLLVGALSVSAVEFALNDAKTAITGLAVFLAAGSRLAPALLRVQQNLLNIRNSLGGGQQTLKKLIALPSFRQKAEMMKRKSNHPTGLPNVSIRNLSFSYKLDDKPVIEDLSLEIQSGKSVAFTGPSGSGKTTLVDLILGVLTPTTGEVLISGEKPSNVIQQSFHKISYVPQEVNLLSTSFLENIAIGEVNEDIRLERVAEVLEITSLSELVNSLDLGLQTILGGEGISLSGGQKQRLGIARALYQSPELLVLDEPTSALDSETEKFITNSIDALHGKCTIVIITHRLATLENVDHVYYLESGRILAEGKLSEIKQKNPGIELIN